MNKIVLFISLIVFHVIPSSADTQPSFSVVANTATSIVVPSNRHAYVQYKVTNNSDITRVLTMVPIPNVTQVTNDNSQCGNPFTLEKNGSCNLTLYVDGALQNSTYSGGPVICKKNSDSNTPDPFLCSQPEKSMTLYIYPYPAVTPTAKKLYVSNWDGGSISLCYINNDSSELSHCLVSAVSDTFINPEALAIKDQYLFVANIGGGMSSCSINLVTGELTDCKNAITDNTGNRIHAPDGIAIDGTTAYISDSGPESINQGVTICTVSSGTLGSCAFKQGTASFSVPSDLAFFNDTVYITNFNSQDKTTYCITTGNLCTTPPPGTINGTNNLLNEPEGLFITSINSTDYAYFTNHGDNTITLCEVAGQTSFTHCANTQGYFSGFGNLTILPNKLKAFIPSGLKTISTCDVNVNDGGLSSCVNSPEVSFKNPSGLVIM